MSTKGYTDGRAEIADSTTPTSKGSLDNGIRVKTNGTGSIYEQESSTTGMLGSSSYSSGAGCQDCLNLIGMGSLGSGNALFGRRENNLFLFKSIAVEGGLTIKSNSNTITISASGIGGGTADSIEWSNILNKPTFFSGKYADLQGKPTLFSGNYADLAGKPDVLNQLSALVPVANKVLATDSTGKLVWIDPPVGGGSGGPVAWADVQNKPALLTELGNLTKANNKFLGVNGSGALAFLDPTVTWANVSGKPGFVTTLSTLSGQGGKYVAVKSDASGLEFVAAPTGGGNGSGNANAYSVKVNLGPGTAPNITSVEVPSGWSFEITGATTFTLTKPAGTGRPKSIFAWGLSSLTNGKYKIKPTSAQFDIGIGIDTPDVLEFSATTFTAVGTVANGHFYVEIVL